MSRRRRRRRRRRRQGQTYNGKESRPLYR